MKTKVIFVFSAVAVCIAASAATYKVGTRGDTPRETAENLSVSQVSLLRSGQKRDVIRYFLGQNRVVIARGQAPRVRRPFDKPVRVDFGVWKSDFVKNNPNGLTGGDGK